MTTDLNLALAIMVLSCIPLCLYELYNDRDVDGLGLLGAVFTLLKKRTIKYKWR